jgi:hypothetical protein
VQAARLIAQGKTSELSALFKSPSVEIARGLAQLAADLGTIHTVTSLSHQSAGNSIRQSVAIASLPAGYSFDGSWAVATMRNGEQVEIQASAEPGSSCRLLALHVHKYLK